ncbi:hypothetical protein ACRRTK_024555 [Alexandromys fortis]
MVEDQVRAMCLSCDISGSCEWGPVFAGRNIIGAHRLPVPSSLSPLGFARESVAMVTTGPVPKEHSWERIGPWMTRKSVSNSVTFQLQPRWLALRQEMWTRGKSNDHG